MNGGFAGMLFEKSLFLLFLHRGYRNKRPFKLRREQKDAGKFDDIVFEYEENGAVVYRFLQAKHTILPENRKVKISERLLFSSRDGDFDLVKYFVSYRSVKERYSGKGATKDFIICTNTSFDEKAQNDIEKVTIKDDILDLVKENGQKPGQYHIKGSRENIDRFKDIWKIRVQKWKSENDKRSKEPEPDREEITDYFKALTFAVDMPNGNELGIILKNEIGEEFDERSRQIIYDGAFGRILDWMTGTDRRDFWTHEDAKALFEDVKAGFTLPHNKPKPESNVKMFELNLYILFLHRGYQNDYRFKLRREQKNAGQFGDLVFEYENHGVTFFRLLQAVNPAKEMINDNHFFSGGDGDFDLVRYFASYRSAKKHYSKKGEIDGFFICTHLYLDKKLEIVEKVTEEDDILAVKKENGTKPEQYRIKGTPENIDRFKSEWKKCMAIWKSRNYKRSSQPEPTEGEIEDYFKALTFIVDMPHENELGIILKDEIGQACNERSRGDIYCRVLERMMSWMSGNDRRDFWTHDDAEVLFDNSSEMPNLDLSNINAINLSEVTEIPFKDLKLDEDKKLGSGSYGTVYKGSCYGTHVAVKAIETFYCDPKDIIKEVAILRQITHTNVVLLMGVSAKPDSTEYFIVMELVEGKTLKQIIKDATVRAKFNLNLDNKNIIFDKNSIVKQMCTAIAFLHDHPKQVIHRDIKPENIMLTYDKIVKVCDLGLAKMKHLSSQLRTTQGRRMRVGTPWYMAPEIYFSETEATTQSDVWSLGCTIVEFYNYKPVWNFSVHNYSLPECLKDEQMPDIGNAPLPFRDILSKCFKRKARDRPAAKELLQIFQINE